MPAPCKHAQEWLTTVRESGDFVSVSDPNRFSLADKILKLKATLSGPNQNTVQWSATVPAPRLLDT